MYSYGLCDHIYSIFFTARAAPLRERAHANSGCLEYFLKHEAKSSNLSSKFSKYYILNQIRRKGNKSKYEIHVFGHARHMVSHEVMMVKYLRR